MQQSMQQLDIFADSRDVVLCNDVIGQLQRRDAIADMIQFDNQNSSHRLTGKQWVTRIDGLDRLVFDSELIMIARQIEIEIGIAKRNQFAPMLAESYGVIVLS